MTLRAKIVILVVSLMVALVAALWLLLSRSWAGWSTETVDRELVDRSEAIRAAVEVKRDGRLDVEDEHSPALADPSHPYRVVARGAIVVGRGDVAWPSLDLAGDAPKLETVRSGDGTALRVLTRAIVLAHDKRRGAVEPIRAAVQVAGPAAPYAALESRFRRGLLLALAAALVVGGVGAALIVQVSLAPLRRLTREIGAIGPASLERRLGQGRLDPDLRRLATAFDDVMGRLDTAMRRQRELVSRASHALRTPVATILTRAEVALRRERDSAAYRDALADVATAAREASSLVGHLLALARLDDRRGEIRREPVPLADVAHDVERLVTPRTIEAGVALEVDVPQDLVAIGERTALRELLEALVDNALRYTPRGGRAGVRASRTEAGCSMEVWDTGPGIPPDERARVLERFQRGSGAQASGAPGSGLGLSIVKAIVDAHEGKLSLHERPGGGLRAIVTLPGVRRIHPEPSATIHES